MAGLPLFFAKRYLMSRKSLSVINIISGVSSLTVAIPVMAMIILLSVFNGFDSLIKSMYRNFDPDIRVTLAEGRFFDTDSVNVSGLADIDGVEALSFVIDENALLEYRGRQFIGTLRGVDANYSGVVPIENMVVAGEFAQPQDSIPLALVGQGVAYELQLKSWLVEPMTVYVPRRGKFSSLIPMEMYRSQNLGVSGIYSLDSETDGQYVIVPISFVRGLLGYDDGKASAVFVKTSDGADPSKVRSEISRTLGAGFKVQTRYQQKESFYRIMQYEKWGIYFIILMVLVIASFSVVGSLVMTIIDKKKDIGTLMTIGADRRLIRNIFTYEGMLISGIGMAAGLLLGIAVCILQQQYGLVKMAGDSFMVDAYPVEMQLTDILGVVVSVGLINFVISRLTVSRLVNKYYIA